ncbi:MAG TPA: di-heme oxidoredictase family protein, partial [Thermodesulfobacteriota bacterium]
MKRMRLIKETYLGLVLSCLLFVLYLFAGCSKGGNSEGNNHDGDVLSGGLATAFNATRGAFNFPVPNLYPDELKKHLKGGAVFQALFVPPPAALSPGLGPIFNNKLCVACHIKNGRGKLDANLTTIFFRVSIPGESEFGGPNPVPGFGTQIQNKALLGTQPEAGVIIEYIKIEGQYPDGTNYSLRKPVYKISNPYVSLPDDILLSPRVAPSVFGMGLLEAIPEETILAVADPDDANGDGISGKPNWVWDFEKSERTIGRFGWKANNPTIFQQSASAFNEDMGVTNPLFPQENSFGQVQYDGRNDDPEIGFESVDAVAFYVRTLAVPARRNADDPEVKRGQKVFEQAKCSSCHITTLK